MTKDKSLKWTAAEKVKLDQIAKKSEDLTLIRRTAEERARERARREIQEAVSVRDSLVKEAILLSERPGSYLSANDIKRAMRTQDHHTYMAIKRSIDFSEVTLELTPWYLEEPYLSNPWNFTKPQYANGFWLYDLTSFYQWTGDPIQMWFGHDTSPGSVEGYSTMSKHLNWGESGPDPLEAVLEQGLPGVPEDARREILEQFTLAIKKAAGK